MAAIWILNILLTSLQWAGINQISRDIYFILWLLCLLVFVVTSIGIRLILRRFHRQSHCHITIFENMRKQRELNLTRNISFIVGVYLLLNMPLLFIKLYRRILMHDVKTYNHYSWRETIAFLNSCMNPFLWYEKSRQIRQAVLAIPERIIRRLLIRNEKLHSTKCNNNVARHAVNAEECQWLCDQCKCNKQDIPIRYISNL